MPKYRKYQIISVKMLNIYVQHISRIYLADIFFIGRVVAGRTLGIKPGEDGGRGTDSLDAVASIPDGLSVRLPPLSFPAP